MTLAFIAGWRRAAWVAAGAAPGSARVASHATSGASPRAADTSGASAISPSIGMVTGSKDVTARVVDGGVAVAVVANATKATSSSTGARRDSTRPARVVD